MPDTAIRVESLSKLYHIGVQQQRHDTLRDALASRFQRSVVVGSNSATDLWAIRDVSFEVKQGEVVGIIGRNGAGKSTLLKVLSRITEPTSGRAEIRGRIASLLEVGTGFHPELTGRENIYLNGAILGMHRHEIARKFDQIVAFAEIERFLDTPVKRYSSGMYVRLAFAVAAHLEPEILLVDEVLAVGDAQFQKKCLGKMGDVAKNGRTVLFVSHNMGAIGQLCPRTLWIQRGRIGCDGITSNTVHSYLRELAPQNDSPSKQFARRDTEAFFTEATIRDASGAPANLLDINMPFHVDLRYTVTQAAPFLEASFGVSSLEGTKVFECLRSASSEGFDDHPGSYRSVVEIPALFLLPGDYLISIALHEPNVKFFDRHENVLRFQVTDSGSVVSRYSGAVLGQVFVSFPWKTVCE